MRLLPPAGLMRGLSMDSISFGDDGPGCRPTLTKLSNI
jgi:hypothetical protein